MALWMVHLVPLVLTAIVETSLSQKSGKSRLNLTTAYRYRMDACLV